ncbi:MAG TPA: ribonuclease HIII, partial [Bacillota bacterium]|nr:ribonuclease HIII [Bacillota bacterium]
MSQIVESFPLNIIDEMKLFYKAVLTPAPNGAIFRAKTNNCVITGYRSGKVLFQGTTPMEEAQKWGKHAKHSHMKVAKSDVGPFHPPESLYTSYHIGSDEAGTGDYFGPITVGAVYVTPATGEKLKRSGIKDSKSLSDKRIQELANEIIALKVPYSLLVLSNEKYNTLQKRGWTQGKMKSIMHHHAIKTLLKKVEDQPLEGILIDQFCEPSIYKRHVHSENESLPRGLYFKTKAESHSIAVAAGSILARTRFVQEMERLSKKVGFELPKGASKKVDQSAAEIIHKHGPDYLATCAKVHFANTHKAEHYL